MEYEIQRQIELLRRGKRVVQETVGWDDAAASPSPSAAKRAKTITATSPSPTCRPWWSIRAGSSRCAAPAGAARARLHRFQEQYGLSAYDAEVLVAERAVADYFEQTVAAAADVSPKIVANWITGELFGLLNQAGVGIEACPVTAASPGSPAPDGERAARSTRTPPRPCWREMFQSGKTAEQIVAERGLRQISDAERRSPGWWPGVLAENPEQVAAYLQGKETVAHWLFGQVMRLARGPGQPPGGAAGAGSPAGAETQRK